MRLRPHGALPCRGHAPNTCHVHPGTRGAVIASPVATVESMRLGIDFGTTRTIVASVDRGNYPVVGFTDTAGDSQDFLPSAVAWDEGTLVYGFDALAAADAGAPLLRSFKRSLGDPGANATTTVTIGERPFLLTEILTGYLAALRGELLANSSVSEDLRAEGLEHVVVAVPAHAHSAQRFLTLEAFRAAGFEVSAMINEPSAAGFEYTHRQGRTISSRRTRVLVYDLGGGTFDASLVSVEGVDHEVLGSLGLNRLGGDDFDVVLAECALRAAQSQGSDAARPGELDQAEWRQLLDQCRDAKEHLSPQSRRIPIDVAGEPVIVPVAEFYSHAAPLVDMTMDAMAPLVTDSGPLTEDTGVDDLPEGTGPDAVPEATAPELADDIAGIYLVGGASGLPLVPRRLREQFGRRVHRSPYPAASTAIGLAIAADDQAGYSLTDQVSRGFGVFREADAGSTVTFDALIDRSASIPSGESRTVSRRYRAAHNLGCFRFVEYTAVTETGNPHGDIAPYVQVRFPFDPALRGRDDLNAVEVTRQSGGPLVEETYVIDENGIITVRIVDLDTGFELSRTLTTQG